MALQRDTKYPGRFTTATSAHPQGPFKNRTSSTSQDGSYLEKDWLNDWDGFFGSLLSKAGLTPNGSVDAVGASQYFNALLTVASVAPVGTSRNLKCSIPTASTTATFTADELVLGTALNGQKYHISSLSKSITLTTTGAGGMDTGSAPVSGYVAIYAILNTTTGATALLGVNTTSAVAPEVYSGSNMPSGYTASALISVWPTNSSGQLIAAYQLYRTISRGGVVVLSTTATATAFTALNISAAVPKNANRIGLNMFCNSAGTGGATVLVAACDANGIGFRQAFVGSLIAGSDIYADLLLPTAQTLYYTYTNTNAGTPTVALIVTDYTF